MLEYRALRRPLYRWIGSLTVCAVVWLWQLAPVVWQGPDGLGWSPFVGALLAVWTPITLGCYLNWVFRIDNDGYNASASCWCTAGIGSVLGSRGAVSPAGRTSPARAAPSPSVTSGPTAPRAAIASLSKFLAAFRLRS